MGDARNFWQNEDGFVVPLITVALFCLFGFAAFALDAGYWFDRQALMSTTADMAAISGAKIAVPVDVANPNATAAIQTSKTQIRDVADATVINAVEVASIEIGCWNTVARTFTPNVNCSAAAAGAVAGANAVGVRSADPTPRRFFSGIFGIAAPVVVNATINLANLQRATDFAVAYRENSLPACLIATSHESDSMYVNGSINLNMPNCGIHLNGGIDGSNNAVNVNTPYLCANGDINNASLAASPYLDDNCGIISTPAAPTPLPTAPTAPANGNVTVTNGQTQTFTGGGAFTKLDINNGGTVNLSNGTYAISGNVTVQGTLKANNATIILQNTSSSNPISIRVNGTLSVNAGTIVLQNGGTIDIQGGGKIPTLVAPNPTAPATDFASNVIVQSGTIPNPPPTNSLGGNSVLNYQGNIYTPNMRLQMRGTPSSGTVTSTMVVYEFEMRGGSDWSNVTLNANGGPPLPTRVHLVQ